MNLLALPAFTDNYIWMLHDGQHAVVVDPGDSAPVQQALDTLGLSLAAILVTHHHSDHVGGLSGLLPFLAGDVYAPDEASIPGTCIRVRGGQTLELLGHTVSVLATPGHTLGHLAYLWHDTDGPSTLFCGDTLFSAGCGRLFEGTPAQMLESLTQLGALPPETRVCCAHEYTQANLRFARAAEPENPAISAHQAHCQRQRDEGAPTLPSSIGLELQINPFLRCSEPSLAACAERRGAPDASPLAVFTTLRQWKNSFQ
jgi:hydroxyacylglutathione hydrolase